MKIYHNPRCSKSRQTLALIEEKGAEVEVVEYLKDEFTKDELKAVIALLGIEAKALVRKGEAIFKSDYKGKELSEEQWVEAMLAHPKLIERPIVVKGKKAVLGRPPENVLDLI